MMTQGQNALLSSAFFKRTITCLALCGLAALAVAGGKTGGGGGDQDDQDYRWGSVFHPVTCDTSIKLTQLKERVPEEMNSPAPVGILPWPGITRVWFSAEKGVFGTLVQVEDQNESIYGKLYFRLYSLCSGRLIGYGSSPISEENVINSLVSIDLNEHLLRGDKIRMWFRLHEQEQREGLLEMMVYDSRRNSWWIRDHFFSFDLEDHETPADDGNSRLTGKH